MAVDIRDLLVLSSIPGIGPNRLRALVSHFRDTRSIAEATPRELCAVEGIEKKTALSIANFFRDSGPALSGKLVQQQLSRLNKVNGRAVTFWDKEYPSSLKKIYDPPPFLFVRGEFAEEDTCSLAIVGTRSPSPYGSRIAARFATELSRLGIPIVSGLARGVDTEAHAATLKAGGRTLAVIGSGIDVVYPPENRQLFDRIAESGVVLSEFLMGAKPDAGNFPRRNRIISGIALGTIIVETGIEGGAMITASTALDQNRAIFAIPSAVGEKRKSGTNLLIKEGKAALIESVEDVLAELHTQLKRLLPPNTDSRRKVAPELSLFEQTLYDFLSDDPLHIDVLAEKAHLSTSDALVHLLSMEFKGVVKQLRGKMFVKS
jgi:DNA processing protein